MEKLQFLAEVRESEKRLDFACNEIHDLYVLIDEYNIPVTAMDRAAYATMDSTYNTLKTTMEEVEGARDDHVSKYSANLEQGMCCAGCQTQTYWTNDVCQWRNYPGCARSAHARGRVGVGIDFASGGDTLRKRLLTLPLEVI